ncbi:diacylglycerol/lipid kinase family protein [Paractinoplanes toevensis]|uniref:DAGKc domain-containing protein n=1 Tax=Paractinoplanes toevensis TaxID=571911 RepID=A0A919T9Y0_9ACTN|nr:diacylglycerol kinase family protein [Actinoplanes toevensis]GIM91182.1 hypothetical protein Ato02nite_029750 [Actinoplanes toevensis]
MADPRTRWMARLAFLAAAAPVVLLLAVAGLRGSVALLLIGAAGMAVMLAGAFWFLSHRGFARWIGAVVVLGAPVTVALLYARQNLMWVVVALAALWTAMVACGRNALARVKHQPVHEVPPPRRPFLIMNPRSGGGKVVRFELEKRARELGADVALLTGDVPVTDLARQALRDGADLLGVAGGDGTQALVAAVAAEAGVPFLVLSAGTRNHFALDLGLDRADPAAGLAALTDGVELRVDLGRAGDRVFVNNVSFGAYAEVVRRPEYRDDKARTALDLLPDLLTGQRGPHLRMRIGDREVAGPQAILVSNNPYGTDDVAGLGRRHGLDGGVLGVLAVRGLLLVRSTVTEVTVEADEPEIPAGIDGESVLLPTPVHCTISPGALRVRVPRHRPTPPPELDWVRLRHLALARHR